MSQLPARPDDPPEVSIVIPVHDEEAILHAAVVDLRTQLEREDFSYEVWLAENGSKDHTARIVGQLSAAYPEIHSLCIGEPNYGRALRAGIAQARGRFVICEEIDLCDVDFHGRAIAMLRRGHVDVVIGSKLIAGASDERPWPRHVASRLYNQLLRFAVGFDGTDTHGLKAFRRDLMAPIAERCVVDKDVFASELVIRAYRQGLRVIEVPVRLVEKRPPSIDVTRRVPAVLSRVMRLRQALRR